jgi:hypothetical protein
VNHLLDLGSRKFWRLLGKPVDLATDHSWLRAPTSSSSTVGDGWLAVEAAHHDGGRDFAARVPLHETFRLYTDPYGVLRTDHELRMWRTWMMRLHYKMERAR